MSFKDAQISEEKLRELLFCAEEFEMVLRKGREYVVYINPKLKEEPRAVIDECVARLVIERCRQRFEFDFTGNLGSERKLMQDIKRFVQQGRFLCIV